MFCPGTIIACGIMLSRMVLASNAVQQMNHDPSDQSASQNFRETIYLSESQNVSTESHGTVVSDVTNAAAVAIPTTLNITSNLICDVTRPKFVINRLLVRNNRQVGAALEIIDNLINQVGEDSSEEIGSLIATELRHVLTILKSCTSSIQACGIDAKPLSANKGINLSDVSWSAFQVVLTLKTTFESVSKLYKPYPLIEQSCSGILLSISSVLASLIGACSEQLNFFDTRFFPLVTPYLQEIQAVDDNFSAFFGSFVSSS